MYLICCKPYIDFDFYTPEVTGSPCVQKNRSEQKNTGHIILLTFREGTDDNIFTCTFMSPYQVPSSIYSDIQKVIHLFALNILLVCVFNKSILKQNNEIERTHGFYPYQEIALLLNNVKSNHDGIQIEKEEQIGL